MKRFVLGLVALGSIACGAFLAETGEERPPDSQTDAAASADGPTTEEGGSLPDGGSGTDGAGADASSVAKNRVTCGAVKCAAGVSCCVTTSTAKCQIGDSRCSGSELLCTRNLDCAAGESCCITPTGDVDPPTSSATCVAGVCPAGDRVLCRTDDAPTDTGCQAQGSCVSGNLAKTLYGLPSEAPWGVCE